MALWFPLSLSLCLLWSEGAFAALFATLEVFNGFISCSSSQGINGPVRVGQCLRTSFSSASYNVTACSGTTFTVSKYDNDVCSATATSTFYSGFVGSGSGTQGSCTTNLITGTSNPIKVSCFTADSLTVYEGSDTSCTGATKEVPLNHCQSVNPGSYSVNGQDMRSSKLVCDSTSSAKKNWFASTDCSGTAQDVFGGYTTSCVQDGIDHVKYVSGCSGYLSGGTSAAHRTFAVHSFIMPLVGIASILSIYS